MKVMQNRGLKIVCGPTGSGKVTQQSAMSMPCSKFITYESPVEFVYRQLEKHPGSANKPVASSESK